ncbi:hypothetical protein AB4Y87_10490 [Paenarthrobacter sp. RAF54_2]|uniref:hypothetical protein n=1 Tax=Paenarthrobacter sp. RAF54_2 TaxID=3233061 RepID=UPI003F94409F
MKKTTSCPPPDFKSQDWTALEPAQRVWVCLDNGWSFTGLVETKTDASDAIWVIHDDLIRTRQVFCHAEGILILPFDQVRDEREPDASSLDWPSFRQSGERHFKGETA